MTVWKLGTKWGAAAPSFRKLILDNSIVISHNITYSKGDLVMIADGFKITAIAQVTSPALRVLDRPDFEQPFDDLSIDYDDQMHYYNADWYVLAPQDQFSYEMMRGIVKVSGGHENYQITINLFKKYQKEKEMQNVANLLKAKGQIILHGPPGTGKTWLAKKLAADLTGEGRGESKLIQFHPAYAYEDFVRGIVAEVKDNAVAYTVRDKVLAEFAAQALAQPAQTFVLIIDEINRANLPAVLGELIYALEYRDDEVHSLYKKEEEGAALRLPTNLLIIGTMNTADRSAASLDYAIRRRFAFVEVGPDESVIDSEGGKPLFRQVAALFKGEGNFLSPEFRWQDVQPGHSYFMKGSLSLADRLQYEIKPLLREYLRDGILLPGAANAAGQAAKTAEEAIAALSA